MANTDSFVEEVNEELRRDQLFALFRKWGWIPILLIIGLVGGAAYREYSIAQSRAAAQSLGDSLLAAVSQEDQDARVSALQDVTTDSSSAQILLALLVAAEQASDADGRIEAAAQLRALANGTDLAPRYRDLAVLKAHMLDPGDGYEHMNELEQLALPGRPYRPLAMEQQALLHVSEGDTDAALTLLRALEQDSQATPGLQQRSSQLIVALEAGSTLLDAPLAVEDEASASEEAEAETVSTEADADGAIEGDTVQEDTAETATDETGSDSQ